jgi:hypothetical protein
MEPRREHGDDRVMWRVTSPKGDWSICEHEQDAKDMAYSANDVRLLDDAFKVSQVLVTAEEWNEMPEFEGW